MDSSHKWLMIHNAECVTNYYLILYAYLNIKVLFILVRLLLLKQGPNVCSGIKVTSNLVWTQSPRESMDMWRRPRKRLQSGGVDPRQMERTISQVASVVSAIHK